MATPYNAERFEQAYDRYLDAPTTLTAEDLSALKDVSEELVQKAVAGRAPVEFMPQYRSSAQPATLGVITRIMGSIVKLLHKRDGVLLSHRRRQKEHTERLDELEQRIQALEQRPELAYAGVYKEGVSYATGSLATHAGGLWLAVKNTNERPGTTGLAAGQVNPWRLIVKRGQA